MRNIKQCYIYTQKYFEKLSQQTTFGKEKQKQTERNKLHVKRKELRLCYKSKKV